MASAPAPLRVVLLLALTSCMGLVEDVPSLVPADAGTAQGGGSAMAILDASTELDAGADEPDAAVIDAGVSDSGTVDAGRFDAGLDSGTATDAGVVTVPDAGDRIPIFVAQGMVGRTTISCDDGRTWVADRSWDKEGDALICGQTTPIQCDTAGRSCQARWYDGTCSTHTPCDCGHSPGFSKGLAFDGTHFVGTWGWGYPGSVRRSKNGVDWTRSMEGQAGFGGIAFGNGVFVTGDREPKVSRDGIGWDAGGPANFSGPNEPVIWSVRRFAYAPFGSDGRFVAIASGNTDRDVLISSNQGRTWWRPQTLPDGCGDGVGAYGDIVGGNGVIVMMGSDRVVCRSSDGGNTWTKHAIADDIYSSGLWTGSEFWFWSSTKRWSSTDGITWASTASVPATRLGPVARSPSGTLVAVGNVWSGYSSQEFFRSIDGIHWQKLATGTFAPSHPIFFITWGLAERSAACP